MSVAEGPTLRILDVGLGATVQDLGRVGSRRWGVPQSGALDLDLLRLGNAVVDNEAGEAAIEVAHGELLFEVCATATRFGFASMDGVVSIEGCAPRSVRPWQSTTVFRGERVRCSLQRGGGPSYLTIGGGFDIPVRMGSRSTFARGLIGGWNGRAVRAGDQLPLRVDRVGGPRAFRLASRPRRDDGPLRVVAGPHLDRLSASAMRTLAAGEYTVTTSADRMGIRLAGPHLGHAATSTTMMSCPTIPGVIQVPPDGQPIVLLSDGQTTGGYPIIALVCAADLPRLGQSRPGDQLRFEPIPLTAARQAAVTHVRCVERQASAAGPAREFTPIPEAIYNASLIGGVVDATEPTPTNVGFALSPSAGKTL